MAKQIYKQFLFEGVNYKAGNTVRRPTEASDIQNVSLRTTGLIAKRLGRSLYKTEITDLEIYGIRDSLTISESVTVSIS